MNNMQIHDAMEQLRFQLLNGGRTSIQAKAQRYMTIDAMSETVTKSDLNIGLQLLEQHLKIYFSYMLGGTVLVAVLFPIFLKCIGVI